jgi:hypothetical protein
MQHIDSDFGTPETQAQGGGITKGYTAEGEKVAKVNHQNGFDRLLAYSIITEQQHRAGEYFRRDAEKAHQFAYIKSSSDKDVKGNMTEYAAESIADAKRLYREIVSILDGTLIGGMSEQHVIQKIVIDDGYLTNFTKNAGKLRKVRAHLHNGLNKLIRHYRV